MIGSAFAVLAPDLNVLRSAILVTYSAEYRIIFPYQYAFVPAVSSWSASISLRRALRSP